MADKVDIDIWGCCVSRDALAIGGNDEGFNVKNYFQNISYPVQFTDHVVPDFKNEDYFDADFPVAHYKWFCSDVNKTIPRELEKSGSEWLLIDSRSFAYGAVSVPMGNGTCEFLTNRYLDARLKPFIKKGYIHSVRDCKHVPNEDKELVKALDKFVDWCKKRYGSKIIMIEVFDTPWHITKDGYVTINDYSPSKEIQEHETFFHDYFYERTDCFFIHCPVNILADDLQKWGGAPVHYVHEVYDYFYKSIYKITHEFDPEKIDRELNILYLKKTCEINSIINGSVRSKNNTIQRALLYAKEGEIHKTTELLDPLVKEDCIPAMECYSKIYSEGIGVNRNKVVAMSYLRKAAELQSVSAKESLFDMLWEMNTPESNKEMIEIAMPLAEKGEKELQSRLGRAYRHGRGVKKNLNQAAYWMRKAYEKKLMKTSWQLFDILWEMNTPESNKEMIEIAMPLAEKGDRELQGRLGRAYRDGRGVQKDLLIAAKWMRKAHQNKLKWAHLELCDILSEINTPESNKEKTEIMKSVA